MRNELNSLKKADELALIAEDMLKLRQKYQKYNKTMASAAYTSSAIHYLDQSYDLVRQAIEQEARL